MCQLNLFNYLILGRNGCDLLTQYDYSEIRDRVAFVSSPAVQPARYLSLTKSQVRKDWVSEVNRHRILSRYRQISYGGVDV
jgi:hypothetical protein